MGISIVAVNKNYGGVFAANVNNLSDLPNAEFMGYATNTEFTSVDMGYIGFRMYRTALMEHFKF